MGGSDDFSALRWGCSVIQTDIQVKKGDRIKIERESDYSFTGRKAYVSRKVHKYGVLQNSRIVNYRGVRGVP